MVDSNSIKNNSTSSNSLEKTESDKENQITIETASPSEQIRDLKAFWDEHAINSLTLIFRVLSHPREYAVERILILYALARSPEGGMFLEKVDIESLLAKVYPKRQFNIDNSISSLKRAKLLDIKGRRYYITNTGITLANFITKLLDMLKRDSIRLTLKSFQLLDSWEKLGDDVGSLPMLAKLIEIVILEMENACKTGYKLKESAHSIENARTQILKRFDDVINNLLKGDPQYFSLYHTLRSGIIKVFSEVLERYSSLLESDLTAETMEFSPEEAIKLLRQLNLSEINYNKNIFLAQKGLIPLFQTLENELMELENYWEEPPPIYEIEPNPPAYIRSLEEIPPEFFELYPSELETYARITQNCKEKDHVSLSILLKDITSWEKASRIIQDIEKLEEEEKLSIIVQKNWINGRTYSIKDCIIYLA